MADSHFAQEFSDLADRFTGTSQAQLSDTDGHRATMRAAGAGAQIIKRAVDAGHFTDLAEESAFPPPDTPQAALAWSLTWAGFSQALQIQFPDRLPPDVGVFSVVSQTATDQGVRETRSMLPRDWRQRSEDWVIVARVLADLVTETGNGPAAGGSLRGTKKAKTRKIDVAITLVVRNPELTDAEIARRAKCDKAYLSRNKDYKRNAKMARFSLVRQQRSVTFNQRTEEHEVLDD